MNMSSVNSRVLIAAVAAVLLLPQLISPFIRSDSDLSETENRNITPFPQEFKWRKIASQLEDYYNDRVPFRRWTVPVSRGIQSTLFPESSDLSIVGKNGFLFYAIPGSRECPYLQFVGKYADPITYYDRKKILDYILKAQMHSEQNNAQFLMVVIPNKINIYPDMLPEKRAFLQQGFLAEEIEEAARSSTPEVNFLYLQQALTEYRGKLSYPLYFAQDTHWNYVGAYCAMKAILDRLELKWPETWPLPENASPNTAESKTSSIIAGKDLLSRAPAGTPEVWDPDYNIAIPAQGLKRTDIDQNYFITENPNAFDQREVLVFRDSFSTALWSYFGAYFRKVHFYKGEYDAEIVEETKPQLVIYSRVARKLPYFYKQKIR